jgi:hypothetical protein
MKVINEDRASVTTKVVVKQLRYIPITARLKRLFLCEEMTQQMRWHKEGIRGSEDADIMSHPMDAEAWHALDHFDPEFARDPSSVGLGLSTDGFQPYNFALMISGPKEPKKQMNIFLCLMIEELKELWQGVDAYDSHLKC